MNLSRLGTGSNRPSRASDNHPHTVRTVTPAASAMLRISFAKVAEYQKRGLVHFHAVIRLDGPEGSTTPPPPSATVAVLTDAIRAAALRVRVAVASDAIGERELTWGQQLDVREIAAFGSDTELTDQAVAAYVAKYATKSANASDTLDRALYCRPCQGRGATLLPTEPRCRAPPATGPDRPGRCHASPSPAMCDR